MDPLNSNGNSAQPAVQTEIIIRLLVNGQLQIHGPLQNKALVYGMLECAKDVVREIGAKHEQPLVAPVTLMPRFGN
jgi:hypothetical protein